MKHNLTVLRKSLTETYSILEDDDEDARNKALESLDKAFTELDGYEDQIRAAIDQFKDNLQDHHLYLNPPITRHTLESIYETAIKILDWVLDEDPVGIMPPCS